MILKFKNTRRYSLPSTRIPRFKRWLQEKALASLPVWRWLLILLTVTHLVSVALYPGGKNEFLDSDPPDALAAFALPDVGDASGFYKPFGQDRFFYYRIHPAVGDPVEGSFPDLFISPRLRYDRWALLSNYAVSKPTAFQQVFLEYLNQKLTTPPLRIELFAARWHVPASPDYKTPQGNLPIVWREVEKLCEFDGIRQVWEPVAQAKPKKGNRK